MLLSTFLSVYTVLNDKVAHWLGETGLSAEQTTWVALVVGIVLLFIVMAAISKAVNYLLTTALHRFSTRTGTTFDDHLVKYRVPRYVARIVPLVLSYRLIPEALHDFPSLIPFTQTLFTIFFIVLFIRIPKAVMRAGRDTLKEMPTYRDKPLDSYLQIASLVLYFVAAILIFSQLTGKSAFVFLTAMGAASAVLLLIFKDTILGFVASIQISSNDMVRLGDWITMEKYGADGNVSEINLTTVKVTNFDMTITTIPTYALIADSFQNWRGMQESGGRRIKRSILIKVSSIRYLSAAEITALEGVQLLKPYIAERREEIRQYNAEHKVDTSMLVNGRNLTNVGLFRRYTDLYLAQHPGVHQAMTRMVRQRPPNEFGLPLEIYCFTKTTEWLPYEGVMADIFDHLLASAKYFHLVVFERPAADDMRHMGDRLAVEPTK